MGTEAAIHQATTRQNIDNACASQLRRLGMGYDTRRSVETTDPGFYRWTQWIFLQIFDSWVDERTRAACPVARPGRRVRIGPAASSRRRRLERADHPRSSGN